MSYDIRSSKLTDVIDKFIDYRGKTPQKSEQGVPLITAKIVKNGFIQQVNEFISIDEYEKWMKRGIPEKGDVVLTTEAPLGEVAQINTENKIALAQRIITLRGKENILDNTFLKYSLQGPVMQARLRERETGSTVTGIKSSELKKVSIEYPNFFFQRKIGNFLKNIDNKIELNNSIISNLEELSQTLFKQWFVDFEFPNENGEPYKSSGGKMVESKLGMIPSKFKVKKLKDICVLKYGKSLTKKNRIPGDYMVYGSGGISGTHNNFLVEGPGLILGRKGSIGTLYLEPENFFPIDTVFYIESESYSLLYLYILFNQFDFTKANNDSAVPGLNRNTVYEKKVIVPTKNLYEQFMGKVNPMFITKFKKNKENKALMDLRDTLLPKLLSGEIELPDESEVTEDVPIS